MFSVKKFSSAGSLPGLRIALVGLFLVLGSQAHATVYACIAMKDIYVGARFFFDPKRESAGCGQATIDTARPETSRAYFGKGCDHLTISVSRAASGDWFRSQPVEKATIQLLEESGSTPWQEWTPAAASELEMPERLPHTFALTLPQEQPYVARRTVFLYRLVCQSKSK